MNKKKKARYCIVCDKRLRSGYKYCHEHRNTIPEIEHTHNGGIKSTNVNILPILGFIIIICFLGFILYGIYKSIIACFSDSPIISSFIIIYSGYFFIRLLIYCIKKAGTSSIGIFCLGVGWLFLNQIITLLVINCFNESPVFFWTIITIAIIILLLVIIASAYFKKKKVINREKELREEKELAIRNSELDRILKEKEQKNLIQKEIKRAEEMKLLINQVIEKVKIFHPLKKFKIEKDYQNNLAGYLQPHFNKVKIEEQRGSSRPDIIINDEIAIEIKGPTTMAELKTLPDKCMRYPNHYNEVIVVLFDIQVSDKDLEFYLNLLKGIFPKIIIIKK